MPEWANNVLIVTAVGAFVAVVIFGLLVLFGIVKPADAESGKWATKKVLFPLVAAVGGAAAALFVTNENDALPAHPPVVVEPATTGPPAATEKPLPMKTDTATKVAGDDTVDEPVKTPPLVENDVSCTRTAPTALADWAAEALGPRPDLQCPTKLVYPACVSELRGRGVGETSIVEAADCGKAVGIYRRTVIAPTLRIKAEYDSNLDDQESSLRASADAAEQAQRDYVIAEIKRMNGREWAEFSRRDTESDSDLKACYSHQARCGSSR